MKINKRQVIETTVAVAVGLALLGGGFWSGWAAGVKHPQVITVAQATNIVPPAAASTSLADFSTFWQAWEDINNLYLRNPSVSSAAKNGVVRYASKTKTKFDGRHRYATLVSVE